MTATGTSVTGRIAAMIFCSLLGVPVISFGASDSGPGKALRAASLDGTWSGDMKCLYDPGIWPEDQCDQSWVITINGTKIEGEYATRSKSGKETRSNFNDMKFSALRRETNEIFAAVHSGDDEDGHWVESWTFTVTLEDPDHLIVHWTRIVNNVDMPLNKKGTKFSVVEMGRLVRTPPTAH
jgi:hypothetical protein